MQNLFLSNHKIAELLAQSYRSYYRPQSTNLSCQTFSSIIFTVVITAVTAFSFIKHCKLEVKTKCLKAGSKVRYKPKEKWQLESLPLFFRLFG